MEELLLCPWNTPTFLIFSENIPPLLYYSHFLAIIAALLIGIYAFVGTKQSQPSRLLLFLFTLFSLWGVLDIVIWATNKTDLVMFLWSLIILIEPAIYAASFYLLYVFIYQKYPEFNLNTTISVLFLPFIVLLPTSFNLIGVNIYDCVANEGPLALYYTYIFETLCIVGIVVIAFSGMNSVKTQIEKIRIAYFSTGIIVFLIAFSSGNIIGSITGDWNLAQAGLFGMPVFIAFLTYTIVKFKAFNVKMFATQALVIGIAILIASRLFYSTTTTGSILSAVTLVAFLISGVFLIRSVKREIEQRERIEKLAEELQETNGRQQTLIHFIGHEVKGFLTKDAGAFASLVDGDFGALPEALKPFVTQALAQSRDGARSVTDILTASNQKKGTVSYTKEPFDLKALAEEIVDKAKPMAEGKGLELSFSAGDIGTPYIFTGDKVKIGDNVFRNIIENSIYYTSSGTITISLKKDSDKFIFTVKDTGIGITDEDKKRLFTEGGHGKDSQKVNVHSTGYGLYIAKNIVEAHNGTIRAESEGEGKGSTFTVELPAG